MLSRAVLLVLAAFWLTMNVLLWRAEYGARPGLGSSVPAHLVWEKLLTAPDSSSLAVYRHGQRIGFCHWVTSLGQNQARPNSGDTPPEGMVPNIANYHLELEGNLFMADPAERLRFDTQLSLGADQQWRDFDLRLNLRPGMWQVHSLAAEQTVRILWQDHGDRFERVLSFADLQHPEALLQEFGGPMALAMWSGLSLEAKRRPKPGPAGASPGKRAWSRSASGTPWWARIGWRRAWWIALPWWCLSAGSARFCGSNCPTRSC